MPMPKPKDAFAPNMKGLLKGLRYISDIFEAEKEEEMQIGAPTDVKHVAHIGMDGPATSKPSWMNEFNAAQEPSSDAVSNNNPQNTPLGAAGGNHESLPPTTSKEKKKSRSKGTNENGTGIESGSEKHSRRNRSSSNHSTTESPSQDDLPDVPKKSRRKKSKASSGGSSKNGNSLPDLTDLES